jgi:hypothetical protein
MESRADDPTMFGPFFTLLATHTVVQHLQNMAKHELLKMPKFVGQNFVHQVRLSDGYPRHRPKPADEHLTCKSSD